MRTAVLVAAVVLVVGIPLAASATSLSIKGARVEPVLFRPAAGESCKLIYCLSAPARVRVRVYDPDDFLVRTVADWQNRKEATNTEVWDGKDDRGRVVPDEAYFFTIEARDSTGKAAVYDPMRTSGGDEIELSGAAYDMAVHDLRFSLDRPSRVMVRAGIRNGPLMKAVVDWLPFAAGEAVVPWDGRDESGLIDVGSRADIKLFGVGYVLPDASVIASGNVGLTCADYLKSLPRDRPRRPNHPAAVRKVAISPFWGTPPRLSRAIGFALTSPAVSKGRLECTLTLSRDDANALRGVVYEIISYVDNVRVAEEERGYSPHPLSLDITKLEPGEHILTVNVASATDRIGSRSQAFRIGRD